ncbi:MAG TPA: deoxyribodipyrimidine photo-lyase [Saprospiraceae bacterium]|nr:deoxyribodipyrimidine photo-lyase [Saprospiraceae bacterium]HMQ83367.1 deoxyribodipyrimidine photo-lyase [Saprospiraceae bacterium]
MKKKVNLFWFRRDLRLEDNAGLYHALHSDVPLIPLFIFDRHILGDLQDADDARVGFIHATLEELKKQLQEMGAFLEVHYGTPEQVWPKLLDKYTIQSVFTNRDYEPYAIQRDATIQSLLAQRGVEWHTFKDHVIFEGNEVLKQDKSPYTVFTPYARRWREKLGDKEAIPPAEGSFYLSAYPTEKYFDRFEKGDPLPIPTLEEMGFKPSNLLIPPKSVSRGLIRHYDKTRDYPAQDGTSRLGIHFRFGTISIREKARHALTLNATYLNELIWRDFYAMILFHFPKVVQHAFRPEYDRIAWRNNESDFERWKAGTTGYPMVDAGMRELNATGYMHNRVRMITASFLTKHLLIDWRWGEAYFARKLLDFDLASNNGGWQWAAGSGTDAAPYFRIFNPTAQQEKFDPDKQYIRQWVPEYGTSKYPQPIVDHKMARERCLMVYKEGLSKA